MAKNTSAAEPKATVITTTEPKVSEPTKTETKTEAPAAQAVSAPKPTAPTKFRITADEFGIHQSARDKRVEILGAFIDLEKQAGRESDFEDAYRARLEAFVKRPV